MFSERKNTCRAHFNLGNLTPGEVADLWLDINVPKKSGSEKKGRERKRDKVLGLFMGAKGNQEKDVEDCRVHIQARCHSPLLSHSSFSCPCALLAVVALASRPNASLCCDPKS